MAAGMAASSLGSFGGAQSDVMQQLMRHDMAAGSSSNPLVAMLASCNAHVGFQAGPRSGLGGLEDIAGQIKRPFSAYQLAAFDRSCVPGLVDHHQETMEDVDMYGDTDLVSPVEKKRRLSFDQVRSLERSFDVENKLEPERKMQLARELNLQPRQVAVWFQNRRARWKIKQLERDYELLNSGFTKLKADLKSALREKDALQAEIQRLSGKTPSPKREESSSHCSSDLPTDQLPASIRETKSAEFDSVCEKKLEESTTVTVILKDQLQTATSSGSNESSSELLESDSPELDSSNVDHQVQVLIPAPPPPDQIQSFVEVGAAFPVKVECGNFEGGDVDPPNCNSNFFLPPPPTLVPPEQGGVLHWWDQWA